MKDREFYFAISIAAIFVMFLLQLTLLKDRQ